MSSKHIIVIGGGAAGMSCALVLGSAKPKAFAANKTIGIITHQKTSHLQNALFNNVLGIKSIALYSNSVLREFLKNTDNNNGALYFDLLKKKKNLISLSNYQNGLNDLKTNGLF